jgi:hypothetical protein
MASLPISHNIGVGLEEELRMTFVLHCVLQGSEIVIPRNGQIILAHPDEMILGRRDK